MRMGVEQDRQARAAGVLPVASLITLGFMGSVIVTPLYPLYQRKFGFSEITLTLIYAAYVVGNVVALLVVGQISDQIGRKRVALPAVAVAGISALLFLFAQGTGWLYAARLLIGLATGVLSGTATAWLAEQYGKQRRPAAALAATAANLVGIALGPLIGGLLAQYAPWPLVLPFIVYLIALTATAAAVARVNEARQSEPPGRLRIHVRLGVPSDLLGEFTPPAIAGFVTFALGGLYFALIPTIVSHQLHVTNSAVSGLLVFELGAIALIVTVLGRRLRPGTSMTLGLLTLLPAVALLTFAQAIGSLPMLAIASALAGVVLAFGYRGGLQIVNEIAPEKRRAEIVSSFMIAVFIGNAVPVIGVGVLTTLTTPFVATVTFAAVIAAFSIAALAIARLHRTDQRHC